MAKTSQRVASMVFVLCTALLAASGVWAEPAARDFKPLAAHYREVRGATTGHAHRSHWFMVRDANRVELGKGDYVELWQREAPDEVSLLRIFHDERKRVMYTPAELRAQQRAPAWAVLNSLIDENLLKSLNKVGTTRFLGQTATRYRGRVGQERIEVVWLDAQRLPAVVTRRDEKNAYELRLMVLRAEPGPNWPKADLARAADYELIDAADLADREYDPFVRKVLAVDGLAGGRAHVH